MLLSRGSGCRRVFLANSGNPTSMAMGDIVSIVEDRCLSDPIFEKSMSRSASDAARVGARGDEAVPGTEGQADVQDSMVRCSTLRDLIPFAR